MGGLRRHFLVTVVDAEKSETRVPAGSVSREDLLPALHLAIFLLSPHRMEKEIISLISLFIRALTPSRGCHSPVWCPRSPPKGPASSFHHPALQSPPCACPPCPGRLSTQFLERRGPSSVRRLMKVIAHVCAALPIVTKENAPSILPPAFRGSAAISSICR